ncbi:hypothetical protein I6N96_09070 [Enterococcus sp. BWM-S5]|uniref:Uncharacterized protein n=1 Tax=Enterococcus larvae TaxID=2794352 RepID=A0ABS4CKW7_9ENTE|nr:hypothetical protein [Enterococcus larvae]MBP1046434.1 hypothetical protein [Enterococcus larvae]
MNRIKKRFIKALPDVSLMIVSGLSFRASLLLGLLTVLVWTAIGIMNHPDTAIIIDGKKRKQVN